MNPSTYSEQKSDSSGPIQYVADQYNALAESTKECVEDQPIASTMVTLGTGFAIGLAVSALIGKSDNNKRSRYAEQISDRVMNGLSSWIPNFRN